jgi:hypothetical protein
MDFEIIKLKIKCHEKFENIINNNERINLYQQYFQIYESKLQNLNNRIIFNYINNYLQNKNCLTNIINSICEENKEIFEDFISF